MDGRKGAPHPRSDGRSGRFPGTRHTLPFGTELNCRLTLGAGIQPPVHARWSRIILTLSTARSFHDASAIGSIPSRTTASSFPTTASGFLS
jgi:hypothetical protein